MIGYEPATWHYLLQSSAASTGPLAGLLFVALLPNVDRLLEFDKTMKFRPATGRAREALIGLLSILVISIVALVPHVRNLVLAAFIGLVAAVSAVSPLLSSLKVPRATWRRLVHHQRVVIAFGFSLCLLTCGLTLAIGAGGGLFWLPAAYVIAIAQASANAWIFAVEVRRGAPGEPLRDRPIVSKEIPPSRD